MKKIEDRGIARVTERLRTIHLIRKELRERKNRNGARLHDERIETVPENFLHAWSPGLCPELFENADDVRDHESPLIGPWAVEHVERESAVSVFGIEIDNVVRAMPWDVVL